MIKFEYAHLSGILSKHRKAVFRPAGLGVWRSVGDYLPADRDSGNLFGLFGLQKSGAEKSFSDFRDKSDSQFFIYANPAWAGPALARLAGYSGDFRNFSLSGI